MQIPSFTYRLISFIFALLLLVAPMVQSLAYGFGYEHVQQVIENNQLNASEDDQTEEETKIYASSNIQAVITSGIQLNFDVIDYLYDFPEPITPLKEHIQVPVFPTQSPCIQNICAYYIAPHAP